MHGQIGDIRDLQYHSDLDFYYRTRTALIDAQRGLGSGTDYDFYRTRAHRLRNRVRKRAFRSLGPYLRAFAAVALVATTFFMLPRNASGCPSCDTPADNSTTLNR